MISVLVIDSDRVRQEVSISQAIHLNQHDHILQSIHWQFHLEPHLHTVHLARHRHSLIGHLSQIHQDLQQQEVL